MDGFIRGGPARPQSQPSGGHPPQRGFSGLNASGRNIDNFKRVDGFYPAQHSSVRADGRSPAPVARSAASDSTAQPRSESLLHKSLPGGTALPRRDKKKSRRLNWHSIRKWTLRSALVMTALVLITGGFLIFKGFLKLNKVFKGGGAAASLQQVVKPELLKGEGDGRVNILLMGKGGPGHDGADLTDTIIVASIDPVNKQATLVSVPRDLWVTTPGFGESKINAVYANAKNRSLRTDNDKKKAEDAGISAVQQVISQVFGIPIHYYGMIDFEGFKQAVDIVGGVDIDVPAELAVKETLWDVASHKMYKLDVQAGLQHFDSMRALYFTRSRHTSLRGDFDRAERQRLFIQALSQKILSAGTYTNPVKISQLMNAFGDHLSTDLTINNALRLADIAKGMDLLKLQSIGLADPPNNFVRTDSVGSQSVVRPTAGFGDYSEIQNYIRNTLKDPYLAKEDARIVVLNGTSIGGLATKKAEQLRSYGYNVTVVGDAPTQDYVRTVLIDATDGKKPFTKNYLEKRLETKSTSSVPAGVQTQDADFVIILGQSE